MPKYAALYIEKSEIKMVNTYNEDTKCAWWSQIVNIWKNKYFLTLRKTSYACIFSSWKCQIGAKYSLQIYQLNYAVIIVLTNTCKQNLTNVLFLSTFKKHLRFKTN